MIGAPFRLAPPIVLASLTALTGCDRTAPVRRCDDDLSGVWRSDAGTYHLLDQRSRLELYPTFRDLPDDLPPGVVAAPSVIDLTRTARGTVPRGTITRRYERGTDFCRMQHPAALVRCADDRLTLELVVPSPPTDWSRCTAPLGTPSSLELRR